MLLFQFREITRHVQHIFVAFCTLVPAMKSLTCYQCVQTGPGETANKTLFDCSQKKTKCLVCLSFKEQNTFRECAPFPLSIQPIGSKQCQERNIYGSSTADKPVVLKTKVCACYTDLCNSEDIQFQSETGVSKKDPIKCYCGDRNNPCPAKRECRTCLNYINKKDGTNIADCFSKYENIPFSSKPNNCVSYTGRGVHDGCFCGCSTDNCNTIRSKEQNKKMCESTDESPDPDGSPPAGFPTRPGRGSIQRSSLPAEILWAMLSSHLWLFSFY